VRLFPGAGRHPAVGTPSSTRRTVATLAVIAVVAGVAAPVAYAGDGDLHHKAKKVHGQIQKTTADLDDVSHKVLHITQRLEAAQGRLVTARASMVKVQGRLKTARAVEAKLQQQLNWAQIKLDRATAQVEAAQQHVVAQRLATRGTVIGIATQGDPRLESMSSYLDSGSFRDLMMNQTGNDVVIGSQVNTLADLQDAEAALQAKKTQVRTARNRVSSRKQAADRTVVQVRGLVKQAVAAKRQVQGLVEATKRDRAAAVRAKRSDMAHLARLKRREDKIQRALLASLGAGANRHVGSTHGLFSPPVANSYITSPYGWRRHPIYGYWGLHDGDDFHAPCGVPERAVGPGKVVSTYYSSVWGNRLYLDLGRVNGHHFVGIYNHISAYRSRVGERVSEGQTLALAGTTGWSTACHLHFTLMRDGTAVDPAPFLGY
jgi:murein DD-endopeptidase MepM/ murein hydrolase activator NlpD